jgi:hypothetical protein
MGLVREIFDEIIPLPDAKVNQINAAGKVNAYHFKFAYAFLNVVFQVIDCIIIPFYTLVFFMSLKHGGGFLKIGLFLVLAFSTLFSISQVIYWFIKSPDDYVSFKDRLMGETAIGAMISGLFRIKIYYYWK